MDIMHPTPLAALDGPTACLVRLSARITAGSEEAVRTGFGECIAAGVPVQWMEEVVLQSYLFAGFPRALNAAREWRRATGNGVHAPGSPGSPGSPASPASPGVPAAVGETYAAAFEWRLRGEETCAAVYGASYEKLRANITALHPALDQWMIVEGYGKVLSRNGLDIGRRELCIVAACAAAQQDRQLHSHLLGARNVGVPDAVVGAAIDALGGAIPDAALATARLLWQRVRGK